MDVGGQEDGGPENWTVFMDVICVSSLLIFGKLFYIDKLLYSDYKPEVLIASFSLARLSNN